MLSSPNDLDSSELLKHAAALHDSGRVKEAIPLYKQLLEQSQNTPEILAAFGIALLQVGDFAEGIKILEQSLKVSPDQAIGHFYMGYGLHNLKRFDKALLSCDRAIALNPNFAEAHSNRAYNLIALKRFDEALVSCNRAISLDPNLAEAHCNHGVALSELKYFDEALLSYDQAIFLKPDYADVYWNKTTVKLSLGDYELGWRLFEWRWKSFIKEHVREFSQPLWLGDISISGKTILIYAEQGFGDVIQFCRYALMVKTLGANVILEVMPPLVSLISTLGNEITIIGMDECLPDFDYQCPIMSLPLAFKTTVENIPATVPYLFADADKQEWWQKKLGAKTKIRIGLACSGSMMHKDDSKRSISLHELKQLLNLPFEFHLLQKEIRPDDEKALIEFPHIQTHQEDLIDFSDTAALIKEMDLVISVDTSVAHLAGALGHPVWVLLSYRSDWRWLLDRTDSPWYPTATLFRQQEMGNWQDVIESVCQKLISKSAADYFYKANDFYNLKQFEEALESYDCAIALNPNLAEAYYNRGVILDRFKRFDEALESYDRAIALSPNYVDAYCNRGIVLNKLKRFDEALMSHDWAIAWNPNYAEAYCNRGFSLNKLKNFSGALASYDCAISLKPDYAEAFYNRGVVLDNLNHFNEALTSYDQAIALNPNDANAHCNRGVVLNKLERFDDALRSYDQAIILRQDLAYAYWNKSFLKLSLGDYELGWQLHEWRWKSFLKDHIREFSEPLWLGDASISGKTVLLYAEQGLGDVIQFCRYAHMAKDLGANVILEVYSPLVSLLSTLGDDITVVKCGSSLPSFDFQCPIMSLPLAFKTTVENIPANTPYLFCDVDKQKWWQKRLGAKTKMRIGLVCSGSTTYPDDSQRSIPLNLLKQLLNLPFEFHLLQKEIRPDDIGALAEFPHIQIHQNDLHNFSDTAALIKEMDLVISVDTSVAHLAGALGCPVWVLLAWRSDFRWLLDRTDSPWYPTATLFRQPEMGNWESVIADICQRLSSDPSATKDTLVIEDDTGLSC